VKLWQTRRSLVAEHMEHLEGSDRQSEDLRRLLRDLLRNADEVFVVIDAAGIIRFVSEAALTFGWVPALVEGRSIAEFLPPDRLEEILAGVTRHSGRRTELDESRLITSLKDSTGVMRDVSLGYCFSEALAPLGSLAVTIRHPDKAADRASPMSSVHDFELLIEAGRVLLAADHASLPIALEAVADQLRELIWVTRASIWRLDNGVIRHMASRGDEAIHQQSLPDEVTLTPEMATDGQDILILDKGDVPGVWEELGLAFLGRQAFIAAATAGAEVLGAVLVEANGPWAPIDVKQLGVVRAVAALVGQSFRRDALETELAYQVDFDLLTGLRSRWSATDEISRRIAALQTGGEDSRFVVALVDIDRFRVVNDSLGHDLGDQMLAAIAQRFSRACDGGLVARLSGDVFVILPAKYPPEAPDEAIEQVLGSLEAPVEFGGHVFKATASAGIVEITTPDITASEVLRRADQALHRAKARGGGAVELDDEHVRERHAERVRSERELHEAIETQQLVSYLQGEWDLRTGKLVGAEALVRWPHATRGLLLPEEFLPLAEEMQLMSAVSQAVIRMSSSAVAGWLAQGRVHDFVLRVNVSARQLLGSRLLREISSTLDRFPIDPRVLCVELTESALLTDPALAAERLARLRSLGVGVAIDDFGTGYSSMLYLTQLPLSSLKIDRSFVAGLPQSNTDSAIVEAIVLLGHRLGVSVTAEGVETSEQRDALIELGCTRAQGYYLSPPESIEAFSQRLLAG
jgi:diguanylate cyclase (GGDEF)-like protein/PAS domain S-box-containing protein